MTTTQTPPPTTGQAPQTALLPLDPAGSPLMATRILPIRANLLPEEITAGRHARRTRTILIGAIVLTIAALGGWYVLADQERDAAVADLATVTADVAHARNLTNDPKYAKVTKTIDEQKKITTDLKIALANDLPWSTVVEAMRSKTGVKKVTLTAFNGTFAKQTAGAASPAAGTDRVIANLNVSGKTDNKATIANYLDAVAKIDGVEHVYLTNAQEEKDKSGTAVWKFSFTADLAGDRICGRFTTPCKSGGK